MSGERQDAGVLAYTLVEYVANVEGEEHAQAYLTEVVQEIFVLEPGVREAIVGRILDDLKQRLRRDDTDFGFACANAVAYVEREWRDTK